MQVENAKAESGERLGMQCRSRLYRMVLVVGTSGLSSALRYPAAWESVGEGFDQAQHRGLVKIQRCRTVIKAATTPQLTATPTLRISRRIQPG